MRTITNAALAARLDAYPRRAEDAAAGSAIGRLTLTLATAETTLATAEHRYRMLRDRRSIVERHLGACDETTDLARVSTLLAERYVLDQVLGTADAGRRPLSLAVQTARTQRNMSWSRVQTLLEQARAALSRHRNDEAARAWFQQNGSAMFADLDLLVGEPAATEDVAA